MGYPADAGGPVRRRGESRRLNSSTDVASTVMARRRFQLGIVRGIMALLFILWVAVSNKTTPKHLNFKAALHFAKL